MEKITVSIRVRPLNKQEAPKGSPWKISANAISLCNSSTGAIQPGQSYVFDSVFGTDSRTSDLYEAHTKAIIASAVKGFNGTVFAYGQTSSGKTFTMRGNSSEPGIIPLAVKDVFENIQKAEDREFLLRVSYMEIYNEEINDLLDPENRKLQIHENIERGIFVAGLREEIVSSPEQVLQLMEFGEAHRHIGETNMNLYSSRSHTIFRMVIESRDRSHDDPTQPTTLQACDAVRVSNLNLVDLAGSERVAKTGAEGARLKEGSHINKSLMTLGTVINKLSEGIESQGGHVPYRDSKLTRILQPALGGNARTVIICNVTPSMVHVDETKGTLQFASRAIRVTNCAQVNEIVTDAALLKRQKREIEELRNKLQEAHSEHLEEEILNLRNAMLKIELERERMASELQDKAARERRMKEQIENLSTLVINSAVDDRHADRSSKKSNRRETWCPRLTSFKPVEAHNRKMFPCPPGPDKRDRNLPLPPPFEKLAEEETSGKEADDDSNLVEPTKLIYVADRRHKSSDRWFAKQEELLELQTRYQDLHCEHEVLTAEIEKLRAENESLKSRSSKKSGNGERRCRSLDASFDDTSSAIAAELQTQLQNLEMEKVYMQRELDSRIEHAKEQANNAKQVLEELYEELRESNQQIETLSNRNMQLEQDKEELTRSQKQLVSALEDLKVDAEKVQKHAFDSLENFMSELREMKLLLSFKEELKVLRDIKERNGAQVAEFAERCATLAKENESLSSKLASYVSQKEREVSHKELEKIKSKLKDVEAKLKTALQDKSKLEAEKAIMDKELRILRNQSNLLQRDLDRRESLADRRRDSVASGLNKAKHQLNSAEQALQHKSIELEKICFELQVMQDAYATMEQSLADAQAHVQALEEELVKIRSEKEIALANERKTTTELEASIDRWRISQLELEESQRQQKMLEKQLHELDSAYQASSTLGEELGKVREELALELTDVNYQLEEERAISASRVKALEEAEVRCCSLTAKLKDLQDSNDKLLEEMKLYRVMCEELEHSLGSAKSHEAEISSQIKILEERLTEAQGKVTEEDALKGELGKLEGRIQELTAQLEEARALCASTQRSLEEEELKRSTLSGKFRHLQESYDELSVELRFAKEELLMEQKQAKEQEADFCSQIKLLEDKLQDGANLLSETSSAKEELLVEQDRARQQEAEFCSRKRILEDRLRQWEDENQRLLVSATKLQIALDATLARAEVYETRLEDARWDLIESREKALREQERCESSLAAAKLQIVELKVELDNARNTVHLETKDGGECGLRRSPLSPIDNYLQTPRPAPKSSSKHTFAGLGIAEHLKNSAKKCI